MNPIASVAKHSIFRTVSVLSVLVVCAGIWFAIDRAFIHPPEQQSYEQKAEKITNVEYNYDYTEKELMFLGVKLWKLRLGVSVK